MDFFCNIENNHTANSGCVIERPRVVEKYFQLDNLFSELVNKHQKAKARKNLGIKETITWDDIEGDITELCDLQDYIANAISSKADIYSPSFLGKPTATTPDATDSSNQLATTQWVMERIEESMANIGSGGGSGDTGDSSGGTTVTRVVFYYDTTAEPSSPKETSGSSFTATVPDDEYLYIFHYNASVTFAVNGFTGGFDYDGTYTINGKTYYRFKSDNTGLGTITVKIT